MNGGAGGHQRYGPARTAPEPVWVLTDLRSEDGHRRTAALPFAYIVVVGGRPGMTEPGYEIAAGAGGHSHLRASHADREQVIDMLKAAFVRGRLPRDEFDLRVGQALASQTYADLAAVTAGIPDVLTRAQSPAPARKSASQEAVTAVACVSAAWLSIWIPVVIVDGINSLANLILMIVLISVVPVSLAGFLLYHAWLDNRAGGQPSQGLPTGAGGEASQRLAPAGPAGQLPPLDHGQRHAARAVPSDLASLHGFCARPPCRLHTSRL